MDATDFKEKLVFVGITAAVFLPLRLVAGQFLMEHWLGNLGIATLISVTLAILIKKKKLGRLGSIIRNQIAKTMWSRSGKIIVLLVILFMTYFGTTLLLIERGNTVYQDDKAVLLEKLSGQDVGTVALHLDGPQSVSGVFGLTQLQYIEYVFAISYAMLDDSLGGWLATLHTIMFMEQIEMLTLLWMFRKFFRPEIPN